MSLVTCQNGLLFLFMSLVCLSCRCLNTLAANGSADLRSPEKEVCFRSWDLANSQMCEVRVATSNICGCNPPNRCGERSGADFATSVCSLAKWRKSKHKCSVLHKSSIEELLLNLALNPPFCQTAVLVAQLKYTNKLV